MIKRNVLQIRKIDLGPVLSTIAKFLAIVERYLRRNRRKKKKKESRKRKKGRKRLIPVKIKRTRAI